MQKKKDAEEKKTRNTAYVRAVKIKLIRKYVSFLFLFIFLLLLVYRYYNAIARESPDFLLVE